MAVKRTRLITMAYSHYSEKARWALDYAAVDYVEERHLPLLHRLHTRRVGGSSVPVFVDGLNRCLDSAAIVLYADRLAGRGALLPASSALRSEALELEHYFDRELGPHARRWAYAQLLGCKALLNTYARRGVSMVERPFTPLVMSLARPIIRRVLRITPDSAARSLERVRALFAQIGERLEDGRSFLVGDQFSAADLTFAALASPVLLPSEFGGALPTSSAVPASMAAVVSEMRATPAGRFALGMYARHRPPPRASSASRSSSSSRAGSADKPQGKSP
jgi:glutathione S-transferase